MAVFWDVAPCSLVEVCRSFRGAHGLYRHKVHRPDDGSSKHLRNLGRLLPGYKAPTSQKTVNFILATVKTLNLTCKIIISQLLL
jgi:hypothetical protein